MVRTRSPIPWVYRWKSAQLSTAGVVAAKVAAATPPASPPRRDGRRQVIAPRVVLRMAGIADLLAAAERRVQVVPQRLVVPPAVPVPGAVLAVRAVAVRRARPLPTDVQLPKA